ncbi:MAG TPA: condensation domain-containing protein [Herpetosiphonaceae bacterium]
MSDIQTQLATLSPEQRRLLELLAHKQAAEAARAAAADETPPAERGTIPRRTTAGPAPLSFGQQRLWLLDQFQPGSPFYNMPLVLRLDGPLDIDALERSLNEIIRRHEILRTTFASIDGAPAQVVAPELQLRLARSSVEDLPAPEREAAALQLVIADAQQPFDLARGPLVRGVLVRRDEHSHLLALTLHHIVFDGWSMGILLREIAALYPAFVAGAPAPLGRVGTPLPIQYADYAAWQRQRLQGALLERLLAYWKEALGGNVTALDLPTDRPRSSVPSFTANGAKLPLHILRPLTDALSALSTREGTTLFMTLLAAFQSLLHRYSGQPNILVGSPIANRNQDELEGMIGFFNNMLVLHGDLTGDPTFRELLGRVRATTLRAYEYHELPFERLVEEFQPSQNMSRSPLFQVMFALQNAPRPVVEQGGLTLQPINVDLGTARFDLSLSIREHEQGLAATLLYNTDVFDAATVSRMLEHYHTLLQSIVSDADQRISALPILTDAERQQLLAWSDDAQIYLLDRNRQLVPIGVPGDVYLSDTGQSVDRSSSHEHDPARAVPHPFCASPDARLYTTDRRARYRADGTLEIVTAPTLEGATTAQAAPYVAPRTPIEEELAIIWMSIIGHERIGVDDDFFALGGHSLSAARLITRVRETFKVDLPMRSLFEATTVAAMAELIVAHEARPGQTETIARVLQRLRSASPEEKRQLLDQKRRERSQRA